MEERPEVEFLWRPHCRFCDNLRKQLMASGIALVERNIWEDKAAAAKLREVARGSETVPTVVVGSWALVNPSGRQVIEAIHREYPGRYPQLPEPAEGSGWWRRWFASS